MENRVGGESDSKQAGEANGASDLLAVASHEIRTPLGAVLTTAEALLQSGLDEQQIKYATILRDAAAALLELSNSLLGATSAAEFTDAEMFRPGDLAASVTALYEAQAKARGLSLSIELAPGGDHAVAGYPGPVRQVLTNLLDNALKYTGEGGVRVQVSCSREDDAGQLDVRVIDSGRGILKTERETIFAPYSRLRMSAGSEPTRRSGQGLGLWIAKRIAEKLKGALTIESSNAAGTTFHLRVPVGFPPNQSMDQPKNVGPVPKSARPKTQGDRICSILVVDDNQGALALAELVIAAFGWTVTKASSGSEALRLLQGEAAPFDCVLTDLAMPGMSGIQLARAIGAMEEKLRIPVLAMSADPPARFGDAAGDSAFQGYVPKPYTPELVYGALMKAMNGPTDL